MGRRVKNHRWVDEPGRLLGHNDPYDIWAKLNWEANQFHALRAVEPPLDIDGMVYLLQNACISVVAAIEWLGKAGDRTAREAGKTWDASAFAKAVANELPNFSLARAIANTFKHAAYRDEGWGDAEIRLVPRFTPAQHERLRAVQGTEAFDEVYAEEAAEVDFQVSFTRADADETIAAEPFVMGLANGALQLIDSSIGDFERFFAAPAVSGT